MYKEILKKKYKIWNSLYYKKYRKITDEEIRQEIEDIFTRDYAEKTFENIYFGNERNIGPKNIDVQDKLYVNIEFGDYGAQVKWLLDDLTIIQQDENDIIVEMPMYHIIIDDVKSEMEIRKLISKKKMENGKSIVRCIVGIDQHVMDRF